MLGDRTTWLVQDRNAELHRQVERERVARTVQRGSRTRRTRSRRWQGYLRVPVSLGELKARPR
jgi:hypothetical protein